jgi:hypothetical protein
MPKSQIVEPTKERQAGSIPFAEVPLNQYQNDLAKEKETYGEEALLGIYQGPRSPFYRSGGLSGRAGVSSGCG